MRSKCLELIGALGRPDSEKERSEDEKLPQDILDEYSRDTDPRVRTSAFKALVSIVFVLQIQYNFHEITFFFNYYRPQTKFAKVMFLHLSVILSTGGACMAGGACVAGGYVWWGVCVAGGDV